MYLREDIPSKRIQVKLIHNILKDFTKIIEAKTASTQSLISL